MVQDAGQAGSKKAHILDEPATNMTRRCGRGTRGERLVCKVPSNGQSRALMLEAAARRRLLPTRD
jgi:hypothetical protein